MESNQISIAVIGGGIAGITAAHLLSKRYKVTLFEKEAALGGHTNTITVDDPLAGSLSIDTGFIVCNAENYPNFYRFLDELDVKLRDSDMSFGYFCERTKFGYTGPTLSHVLRNPENLLRPAFLRLWLLQRSFNRKALIDIQNLNLGDRTLGEYLEENSVDDHFIEHYLLPISAAVWSSPDACMREFPVLAFLHFFRNHGMLEFSKIPQWQTVVGGSQQYIKAFRSRFPGIFMTGADVVEVAREPNIVRVVTSRGDDLYFDRVVFATHADDTLRILTDPSDAEAMALSSWKYHKNPTVLHYDTSLLPAKRRLWASWNYTRRWDSEPTDPLPITYHMNRLQGLRAGREYLVTLNDTGRIDPAKILYQTVYTHPEYRSGFQEAQRTLKALNGLQNTFYCGSYLGYGFHEDAVASACTVAERLGVQAWQ